MTQQPAPARGGFWDALFVLIFGRRTARQPAPRQQPPPPQPQQPQAQPQPQPQPEPQPEPELGPGPAPESAEPIEAPTAPEVAAPAPIPAPIVIEEAPHEPSPFVRDLVEKTEAEWRRFGSAYRDKRGGRSGQPVLETDEPANSWIREYFANVTNNGWDGRSGMAWSAAFISTCMLLAGSGNRFKKNAMHCVYINDALRNKDREDANFQAKRIDEYAPRVGDVVCGWRINPVNFDNALTVKFPDSDVGVYSSHTDIVTAVRPGEIDVVGGNVGNSVTKMTIGTLPDGRIDMNSLWAREKNLFAIMKNNL